MYSLGRQITAAQAKRLDSLSYEVLGEIRVSCSDFNKTLLKRGVKIKQLREAVFDSQPRK